MQLNKGRLNRKTACAKAGISRELNYKRDDLDKIWNEAKQQKRVF